MTDRTKAFERRLLLASVVDALVLGAAAWMFIETGEMAWIIGGFVLSSLPILYVILSDVRSRSRSAEPNPSIVQDSRERR